SLEELVMRRSVPPVRPPAVMSYSQMLNLPAHAGWAGIFAVFEVGQFIANTIFLPSYETEGSTTSPLPCVNCAVMLCSGALGEDFSRMIRSPPGANGFAVSGLIVTVFDRIAYAIGTSPLTVTVLESVLEPDMQAATSA